MQSGKNATASMREVAANMGASAKAGMDKTKATVQEKAEKLTSHDPVEKEMAAERKQEKVAQAELNKQEAREHNAAARQAASAPRGTQSYSTTGVVGQPTGAHQLSALPGHGTGQPMGQVTEGVVGSHPPRIHKGTETGRTTLHKTPE